MARGKRRRPLLASPDIPSGPNDAEEVTPKDCDDRDDVEDFVANRHTQMANNHGLQDSNGHHIGDEPETMEHDVLNIDTSDSDILDEEDIVDAEDEEKGDWGGNRKNWYGGDTHEYEIMEDDEREELLQDEEEEAIRLQKKALNRTRPEDYLDDYADSDVQGEEEQQKLETEPSALGMNLSVPELDLLTREFQKSSTQLSVLKQSFPLSEIDRIRYQLLSLFVTNVALYFSVRTDPDSLYVDLRTHPVLARIIQIRSLLRNTKSVPNESIVNGNGVEELGKDELANDEEQRKAGQNQNGPQAENGMVNGKGAHRKQRSGKRKEKRRKNSGITKDTIAIAADEERIHSLLQPINDGPVATEKQTIRDQKRRKLNKIVGAMERERKNSDAKRMAPADLDLVREVRDTEMPTDHGDQGTGADNGADARGVIDDDEVMSTMLAKREKKEARKARKAAASTPHVYTFKDEVPSDGKRKASYQVVKNRGLTRYRPRDKKTPRTKNRLAYRKAVVRRKGAVREYAGAHGGSYGGEASGINMSARRSSML